MINDSYGFQNTKIYLSIYNHKYFLNKYLRIFLQYALFWHTVSLSLPKNINYSINQLIN